VARNQTVLTADQVKSQLRAAGLTTTAWAKERGYKPRDVYRVLNGQMKANFGRAHKIAVELGLKPSTSASSGNQQSRKAA